jgi:hypothetical protein
VADVERSNRSTRDGCARRWPCLAAIGAAFLLVPGAALSLPPEKRITDTAAEAAKPRFGKVTFKRVALLDEPGTQARLTLTIEARIARNGARTFNATLGFDGRIECMSPGQCSACPGVVLPETASGSVRAQRTRSRPLRITSLSKKTFDVGVAANLRVERQRTELTDQGCETRTVSTSEVWTFQSPSAREIGGKAIKKLRGSVSRSLQAPPGGHVCGLAPYSGWAFTTCQETLVWKLG